MILKDSEIREIRASAENGYWPFTDEGFGIAKFVAKQATATRCREARTDLFLDACPPLLLLALDEIMHLKIQLELSSEELLSKQLANAQWQVEVFRKHLDRVTREPYNEQFRREAMLATGADV